MISALLPLTRRPRRTLIAIAVFILVAGAIGGPLAGALRTQGGFAPPHSESQQAITEIEAATRHEAQPGILLLLSTPRGAAAASGRVGVLARRLAAVPGVATVAAPAAVGRDDRYVLLAATLRASAHDGTTAGAALTAFAGAPDVTVGGSAVAGRQISRTVSSDLGRSELLAFPVLLVLSLLIFRRRAALLPLAAGVTTVLGTFLVLTGVNKVYGLSVFALNLVIGLGLGLAIDYTLFLLTRFREELLAGADTASAVRTTMLYTGRTVLFSAATVAAALATLVVFPQNFLKSMGLAGATVALVAALAALTVTPALLTLWGERLTDRRATPAGGGRWYRFAHAVMRRPGVIALATAAIMLAIALPSLGTVWTPVDQSAVPAGMSSRTVSDVLARDFAGADNATVTVAIRAAANETRVIDRYAATVGHLDGVTRVAGPRPLGRDTWQLDASVRGTAAGPAARRVVAEIRALRPPFATRVTGDAATFADQQAAIADHLPIALGLLVALTVLVLWLMTGSVLLPLKAVVMNALTVSAALAPLTLIYQHGRLTGLLGYTPNGGVEPSDFLVTATLVFALSTDYGVFLLGRIKEAHDAGAGEREAVAQGLARTGRVITAAAILLAVAIGFFSTSSIPFIQQIGIATATGVLLDAFVVRSLLVPSLMALLGRANWWSPAPLRRLHARIAPAEARETGRDGIDSPGTAELVGQAA